MKSRSSAVSGKRTRIFGFRASFLGTKCGTAKAVDLTTISPCPGDIYTAYSQATKSLEAYL
jgi:hypothetical protein